MKASNVFKYTTTFSSYDSEAGALSSVWIAVKDIVIII